MDKITNTFVEVNTIIDDTRIELAKRTTDTEQKFQVGESKITTAYDEV